MGSTAGTGTALTAVLAHGGLAPGATSASLQTTPMAERVYAAVDPATWAEFLEYAPHD